MTTIEGVSCIKTVVTEESDRTAQRRRQKRLCVCFLYGEGRANGNIRVVRAISMRVKLKRKQREQPPLKGLKGSKGQKRLRDGQGRKKRRREREYGVRIEILRW